MDLKELQKQLKQYTEMERTYLRGVPSREIQEQEFKKYPKIRPETYLFQGVRFIPEGMKFSITRQDRFSPVLPHCHDYIEINYVYSGNCNQTIEGERIVSQAGDLCIFDTDAVHSIEAAGEEDIIVNILLSREFFDSAFLGRMTQQGIVSQFLAETIAKRRKDRHFLFFPSHKSARIRKIMAEILLEHYSRDIGMEEVQESYILILFTELFRFCRDNMDNTGINVSSGEIQIMEMLSYMEKNFQSCTLSEMADHFGFHRNYLTTLLKEKTGSSFVEHIQKLKLKRAKTLLRNTDIAMADLIPLCGYQNLSFFYKKFKEEEGCTPAEYRSRKI